jgi:hypothetical protein
MSENIWTLETALAAYEHERSRELRGMGCYREAVIRGREIE